MRRPASWRKTRNCAPSCKAHAGRHQHPRLWRRLGAPPSGSRVPLRRVAPIVRGHEHNFPPGQRLESRAGPRCIPSAPRHAGASAQHAPQASQGPLSELQQRELQHKKQLSSSTRPHGRRSRRRSPLAPLPLRPSQSPGHWGPPQPGLHTSARHAHRSFAVYFSEAANHQDFDLAGRWTRKPSHSSAWHC